MKKSAFITGAASGIGRAAAHALAASGLSIGVADANLRAAQEVASELEADGHHSLALEVDVTDRQALQAAVAETENALGVLSVAVNSAGIQGELAPAAECTLANWDRTLTVNLTGTFLSMQAELMAMLSNSGGSIVNLASNFGLVGKSRIPAYCASKHGVIGLTRSASLDYAQYGIRVNAVCPGPVDTPLLRKIAEEAGAHGTAMRAEVEESVPMGRLGEADEIGRAIAFLCSDAASFITGIALPVDGGFVVG